MTASYNPDFDPSGIEGGVDTATLPWIALPHIAGLRVKPLRASAETGLFTVVMHLAGGTVWPATVHLGAMDLLVLSGELQYPRGELAGRFGAGSFGYIPANARVEGLRVDTDTELLVTSHGALCFLAPGGSGVAAILTSMDIRRAAYAHGISLVPDSLAGCMQPRSAPSAHAPLTMSTSDAGALVAGPVMDAAPAHPHFIDTRALPWLVNPDTPDVGLKILRVSEETGFVSVIVRHNGVAPPHYHLGAADFMVLAGRIGYRAGPPEGYGPGVWFYEPAGARHDATQRLTDEDLIYTANLFGPIQFDSGRGTPIGFVFSWMTYKAMADAAGVRLLRSHFADDNSLLAWEPLGSA
jgi:quercetin dioxygenase-like cupin family protein